MDATVPSASRDRPCSTFIALLATGLAFPCHAAEPVPGGGAGPPGGDVFTAAEARALLAEQERGARALGLPTVSFRHLAPAVTGLAWPLAPNPGAGLDWHGISNFVDLNPAFPGQVLDFNCGARTYDTTGGYNHGGTDLFLWPFAWTTMDAGTVSVVAAAPGTIIAKADGNNDRSCSANAPDTPNYVFVQHADGTVAWYLHMKNGSVTSKPIGSTVVVGETLGKVGSSGVSTGPHLHLELRASAASNAAVIDPFTGSCNAIASAWASQPPYYDSAIVRLATHSAPPAFPSCPTTSDTPNLKSAFLPGEALIVAAYYRDQRWGQVTQFRIRRPDNSLFASFSFDSQNVGGSQNYYAASYWYWNYTLPANAADGTWSWEADFQSRTLVQTFEVSAILFKDGFE